MSIFKFLFLIISLIVCSASCTNTHVEAPMTESNLWRYKSGVYVDHASLFPEAYIHFKMDNTVEGFNSEQFFTGNYLYNGSLINMQNLEWAGTSHSVWANMFDKYVTKIHTSELIEGSIKLFYSDSEYLGFDKIKEFSSARHNSSKFQSGVSDNFDLIELHQIDNYLEAIISYAGGCGEVDFEMVGSGGYDDADPPHLDVKLLLDDQDLCEAQITGFFYFDIQHLQYPGSDELIIDFEEFDQSIHFQFDR